jgi:ribosomal-protein-alanine acetyltransferase
MTWQLRRAGAGDLDGIMLLEASIFGTDAWSRATMLAELGNENCWYLVAFRPEAPESIEAYAGLLAPRGAKEADIQTIAVAPEARRSGLGRTIMLTLVNEAVKRGAEAVLLEVRADNPGAQALYRSLGFEQLAVRERYYQPDGVDALVMRLIPAPRGPALAAPVADSPRPGQAAGHPGGEAS